MAKAKKRYIAGCADCRRERKAIPRERIRKAARILGCTFAELKTVMERRP